MMSANDDDLPGESTPPEEAPDKRRQCRECGAMADRLAVHCPECKADLPMFGHARRSSRGRRYVYGKRKAQLSQEAIWLIVVIIVGLLIVFGVQVVAFMRSKKLMMAPTPPRQMIARAIEQRPPETPAALRTPGRAPAASRSLAAFAPPDHAGPLPSRRDPQLRRPMT
jgi:hypothetical protein